MQCGPIFSLILWEIICVFPVYLHIIIKITLSNPCLWLRTHNSAKEKVWLHLFSMFQHIEPKWVWSGGESNYSLIQCWNPYQMCKAWMSRSRATTAAHCCWTFHFLRSLFNSWQFNSVFTCSYQFMLIHCEILITRTKHVVRSIYSIVNTCLAGYCQI